jgi:hypothetical protein
MDDPTHDHPNRLLDPSLAAGWSKLALMGGVGALALGDGLTLPTLAWAGVALATLGFTLNTAAKLRHYRDLPLYDRPRTVLSVTWVLLSLAVPALLLVYALDRFVGGPDGLFWPLLLVAAVAALLHGLAQAMFLPDEAA